MLVIEPVINLTVANSTLTVGDPGEGVYVKLTKPNGVVVTIFDGSDTKNTFTMSGEYKIRYVPEDGFGFRHPVVEYRTV